MEEDWPDLNLPDISDQIRERDGTTLVWDTIRKKDIVLTKEEWVRQRMIKLLISHLNYPRSLIKVESEHLYGKKQKRSDILVFNNQGTPFMLIECKSWEVRLNQSVLNQIGTYNKILGAPYIAITNGLKNFCWKRKGDQYSPLKVFPDYSADSSSA